MNLRTLALFALSLALAGCGGKTSHDVTTPSAGSLLGIGFLPDDHSLDVSQGVNPTVYWDEGYTPPAQFTIRLRRVNPDSTMDDITTDIRQTGSRSWELRPTSLEAQTIYYIWVTNGTQGAIGMFLTGGTRSENLPAAQLSPEARKEHRVLWSPER